MTAAVADRERADTTSNRESAKEPFSIVCLSSQPWEVDLPTNRQQIMLRAARRGHRVLFVETGDFVGRRPSDGRRRMAFRPRETAQNVFVVRAPNVLPWGHRYATANNVNGRATAALVARWIGRERGRTVLWMYDPCTASMVGNCGEACAVYDCVDDYAEQAGADARKRAFVAATDRRAAQAARVVFATAAPLAHRHRAVNPNTHLVRNVADFEHFHPAANRAFAADDVRDLARPMLGFVGNFLDGKVDFRLLEGLARSRPDWTVVLVGPGREQTQATIAQLAQLPNVHFVGPKPYSEVPRYVAAFDVAIIPYLANEYTRSCFPLKTFEYLAAEKPVVATGLPELADVGPDVALTNGLKDFIAAVEAALASNDEIARRRRRTLAAENTWESRTERMLALVAEALEGGDA